VIIGNAARRAWPRLVRQAFQALHPEAFSPLADTVAGDVEAFADGAVGKAICAAHWSSVRRSSSVSSNGLLRRILGMRRSVPGPPPKYKTFSETRH